MQTELVIANRELAFQKKEKGKKIRALIIANKELVFQDKEKKSRAAELLIANKELDFQRKEKKNRAAELSIAKIELKFQNKEKKKRAAELILANKELNFQNKEKKKRAKELVIANEELAFQKDEKEKREEELVILTMAEMAESKKNEAYIGHLAAIVESSDDAIISKSMDGMIKSWNRGGEKMFGFTAKQAIGKNIAIIIPADYIKEEKSIIERIRNNEVIEHFETIRNKKNGKQFYVSLTISPLKDRLGNIIGVSKIARDITVRKKFELQLITANQELNFQNEEKEKRAMELIIANKELAFQNQEKEKRAAELIIINIELLLRNKEKEERAAELAIANRELARHNEEKEKLSADLVIANQELAIQNDEIAKKALELEKVNKELESFSYSVSHDLRAPLRAINGFAEVLIAEYPGQFDEEVQSLLKEIIDNSNMMGELIDNLLEFSRMGKQGVSLLIVDVKKLVDSVVVELKQADPSRNVNVTVKNLGRIKGDKNMLKQVFINLISNAFKYTGKKPEAVIEIGSYQDNGQSVYYVKDNGAGFDMHYYDKLFGVFQRLHSSNEFDGTGVGLAIIQKIIAKHNGKVWAVGKVDEGATFYFSIPNN